MNNMWRVEKTFLSQKTATDLRKYFLSIFSNPRKSHPKRFLWDHWYIENQYKMHRSPAQDFFSPKLYKSLCDSLVKYGQDELGCHSISKPWLSYYTDGDSQSLHTDSPHGPWAYVYSLTDWLKREFRGGETQILNPKILNYWPHYSRSRGREAHDLFLDFAPEFNQLLLFDPRLPHGVRRVSGVEDPCLGRLVVHGWYVNPEPYVVGALGRQNLDKLMSSVNEQLAPRLASVANIENICGTLILRLTIEKSGRISNIKMLTNTLIDTHDVESKEKISVQLIQKVKTLSFSSTSGRSQFTLPFIFD